jgi:hypothetical protein
VRYLVLPERPSGTEGWDEEALAAIVTRDAMIGVAVPVACRNMGSSVGGLGLPRGWTSSGPQGALERRASTIKRYYRPKGASMQLTCRSRRSRADVQPSTRRVPACARRR